MARGTFKARKSDGLVARELGDEIVIYDTGTDHCHVLNPAAAVAWKRCESGATMQEIAEAIARETELPADARVAGLALDELAQAGLLDAATRVPESERINRRQLLKGLGVVAAALPVVSSLSAPSPAMAATPKMTVRPTEQPLPTTTTPL